MSGFTICSLWILQVLVTLVAADLPQGFDCRAPGNYSSPGSCRSYVECLVGEVQEGVLAPHQRSCGPGKAFSPLLRRCLEESFVKGCHRSSRHNDLLEMYDPSLDYVCHDHPNQYVCANCKTLVNCVNGRAHPRTCGFGDFCFSNQEAFGGDVCYPGRPKGCVCEEANVFYQDAYDAEAFFMCDEFREIVMHYCPDGHWFDASRVECRSSSGLPSCTTPGTFAVESDCRRYYACVLTTEGFLQHEFRCPDYNGRLFYNEEKGLCDDPCDWRPPKFECSSEGRFADPTDCRQYFVCTWDASVNTYRQVLQKCPDGFEWQQMLRTGVGHCTTMMTVQCTPVTTTKCTLPPGLCT